MKKILLSIMFLFAVIALQAQTIIYVKPDASGNGTSWGDACDLETVVGRDVARNVPTGAQIWVQKGTYYPSYMLTIPNSVKMFGGFSGSETQLSQRDSLSNSTIIDAQQKFGSVIRLGISSELNGFVIQNGSAQNNPHGNGGGVFADDHSVIANCLIINNTAIFNGGGVYAKGPVELINSTVKNNMVSGNTENTFGNCLVIMAGSGLPDDATPVVPPVAVSGCNSGTFDFGKVSFASTTEHTISGNGITQIWSDAVTATNCQKTGFNGGSSGNYMVDCRSNPDYTGNYFSWCAVARYGNVLCPNGWRVPTKNDFIDLGKALGGSGDEHIDMTIYNKFVATSGTSGQFWGGSLGSYCSASGVPQTSHYGSYGCYWAQTEYDANNGYDLDFYDGTRVRPQSIDLKYYGIMLRCVRSVESPTYTVPSVSVHPSTSDQSKEQNAEFSVLSISAEGTAPLSYQWYSNTENNNTSGTLISGATSATYTPLSSTLGTLYYYCKVTNSFGSATSNVSGLHTVVQPFPTLNFDYTGTIQQTTLDPGVYKIECWGAQGGGWGDHTDVGHGGYSVGILSLTSQTTIYIGVGGRGYCGVHAPSGSGYNGGGTCSWGASGGGASHVATTTGVLSSLSGNRTAVLIVAGGGGTNGWQGQAGVGGGITGGNSNGSATGSGIINVLQSTGGTQTTGGSVGTLGTFGQGATGTTSAGGGGWFGGGASGGGGGSIYGPVTANMGGGGGSGYIGGVTSGLGITATSVTGNESMPNPRGSGNITGNTGNGFVRISNK